MRWDLYEEIEKTVKRRGYKNVARYFLAIAGHDLFKERRFSAIKDMANATPVLQDLILTEFIKFSGNLDDVVMLAEFLRDTREGSDKRVQKKFVTLVNSHNNK